MANDRNESGPDVFHRFNTWITDLAGAILTPIVLYYALQGILYGAGRVHWILELLITIVLAGLLAILLRGIRGEALERMQGVQPRRVVFGILLTVMFLALAVFSTLSFLLWQWHPESYKGTVTYTPGKFADFYVWVLIDELPLLKIPATYGIPAPLHTATVLAATLVLVFRVFVILRLLDAGRIWFRLRSPKIAPVSP